MKKILLFLLMGLPLLASSTAADNSARERKAQPVEIQAREERRLEEIRKGVRVPEIREEKKQMPEIPKPVTRGQLGPAEQARLDDLEHRKANGTITQTQYDLEKDT